MTKPVPREPTQAMVDAASNLFEADVNWCAPPEQWWEVMWDAAPAAQAEPVSDIDRAIANYESVGAYGTAELLRRCAAPSDDARDAARLKQRVSEIFVDALSGRVERYIFKYADPDVQFVRWGHVEDDIHAAIDAAMRADK